MEVSVVLANHPDHIVTVVGITKSRPTTERIKLMLKAYLVDNYPGKFVSEEEFKTWDVWSIIEEVQE